MNTRFIPRTSAPPAPLPGGYYQALVNSALDQPDQVLEVDPVVRAPKVVYQQIRRATSQLGVGKRVESWIAGGKVYVAARAASSGDRRAA
jgi:hypothetical protein